MFPVAAVTVSSNASSVTAQTAIVTNVAKRVHSSDRDSLTDVHSKRRRIIDWSPIHEPFQKLYKVEGRSLRDTRHLLEVEYGFAAS